ncbi:MAG: hypothetical protein EOO01_30180 [Chitinophagaceae bacterium]|nr:MAG: hypothetical protein EOO01_30180 [Chitinophagaceae bacterium]
MSNGAVIQKFIEDFNLKQPDGVIGFAAKIKFHMNGHTKTRYTEVQILVGDKLNTIYLINPDLPFEDLPDTFMAKASTYKYTTKDHLSVVSRDQPDNFVEIFPVTV